MARLEGDNYVLASRVPSVPIPYTRVGMHPVRMLEDTYGLLGR